MIAAVTGLLPLPDAAGLAEQQRRGLTCIWCGIGLAPDTAVDLSPREDSDGLLWFPRGCRWCVGERAHRVLFEHAAMCEQCVDEASRCGTGRILYRLIREGRR